MLKQLTKLAVCAKVQMTILASTAVLCCSLTNTAQALPFNQISQVYFFGDSLSDSGFNNLFPGLPVGKAPTFTTFGGHTWSQYVARDIKGFVFPTYPAGVPDTITNNTTPLIPGTWPVNPILTGVDYAAGGSTTNSTGVGEVWAPSLHTQIAHFLATSPAQLDPKAVYFIWEGANDLLALFSGPMPTQVQFIAAANTAATNIAGEVAALSARGAKRIVVMSLPNIGYTPLIAGIAAANNIPTLPATMKTVTFTFNSILNQQLGKVISRYGIKVLYVDVYDLLDNVIIATKAGRPYVVGGESFQFVNFTDPACGNVPSAIFCPSGTPTGYLFADTLHPTDMGHRLLSLQVETDILGWK
jgi:outer membrane lipase/esterase